MKGIIGLFGVIAWIALAGEGVWGVPFRPYEVPHFGGADGSSGSDTVGTTKLALKRSPEPQNVHPEIARVQAVNRAFKKFAGRLGSPVKRDAQAEIQSKHFELIRRGELPGEAHILERRQNGVVVGDKPTISPAVVLDEDGQDITYFSPIQIGNRGKSFLVVMDTGSSDLWVPAADCKSVACQVHKTLGSKDSSTFRETKTPWQIKYGSGSASGVLVADSLSIGGLTVRHMPFGVATVLSDNFAQFAPDGILGLALTQANAQGVPTVMDQLANNTLIKRKLIGVNLQRAGDTNDGEISFGVVDNSKFTGSLTILPNIGTTGLWEVPIEGAFVNGKSLGFRSKTSITDTGTTLILMPPNDAGVLHNAIPNSITDGQGNFAIPCNTNASIQIQFNGQKFSISSKDYVGAPVQGSSNLCVSNILGQQVGSGNQWLMGDVFLKNVYTVFDYDNNKVGFGSKETNTNEQVATGNNQLQSFMNNGTAVGGSSSGATSASVSDYARARNAIIYTLGTVVISIVLFF